MATWLWAALAAAAVASTSSSTLLGEHVCNRTETHNVTVKVRSKEPVTLRTYEWCIKVPPRCSRYHTELRDVDRTQTVSRERVVHACCPGFQKEQHRCVPEGGASSRPPASPSPPETDGVPGVAGSDPGAGSPYWQQLRLTDAPDPAADPPPQFSAEVTAQQKGPPPASAFPKKDTRLAKKGAPDKTAGVDKEKPPPPPPPLDAVAGQPATAAPEAQTAQPPSPPPLPPELDLPPPLGMPPVPAMSEHNQSLSAGSEPEGPGRSGRRRVPPETPLAHADLPPLHWEERAEPGADAHEGGGGEAPDHEPTTSTPPAEPTPGVVSKDAISKAAPRKKASDVKEVPAYARKTATPPPTGAPQAAGAEGAGTAAGDGPEDGSWESWGWQPVGGGGGDGEHIEHRVLNGRRKAAHAKRARGEDLKSLPPGKDPDVSLLVMADPPAAPVESPPAQDSDSGDVTMPTWLPVAIGGSALVIIVVVSVSAAILARGRRRYVAGAAGGGPATMELRPISHHSSMGPDPLTAAAGMNTSVAAPVFLSPVFMQPAEAAGAEARPGGGGGGQGLLLAAVLGPPHALCSPRTSSFIDSLQTATYDVPPPPQSAAGTLPRGLQLHHMCTTPPPQTLPPPQTQLHPQEPLQHVYEELPACWQRPLPACL